MTDSRQEAPGDGSNRLGGETSPYLRQHAGNPVHWWPWCPEALEEARRRDLPIFLSIGYSACHWCHVMEHESFENPRTAALLNESFVSIKVDREERPDLDAVYMQAVMMMTGAGGWPMSVFLTPDLKPFFGGTYFPPDDRFAAHGRPGFPTVLRALAQAWQRDRQRLTSAADEVTEVLQSAQQRPEAETPIEVDALLIRAATDLDRVYDDMHGGFGGAPKFPHAMDISLLLRLDELGIGARSRPMALSTLRHMAAGGIHDHLRGGFHRYSTDDEWLVPHFEKMLYDQALLLAAYADAGLPEVAGDIIDYLAAEMHAPNGGFYSAQDADSEGEEGRYFVWTPGELEAVLGASDAAFAASVFGVTPGGNFEHGTTILTRVRNDGDEARVQGMEPAAFRSRLNAVVAKLLARRQARVAPLRDEKQLTAWNALMAWGLARAAARGIRTEQSRQMAVSTVEWILATLRRPDGRLFAVHGFGRTHLNAYLDDHAYLVAALLELCALGEPRFLSPAIEIQGIQDRHFLDPHTGAYFQVADDHEQLLVRLQESQDNALPSGNSVSLSNLVLLHEWTGDSRYLAAAERLAATILPLAGKAPRAFPQFLQGLIWLRPGRQTVVVVNSPDLVSAARKRLRPGVLVVATDGSAADQGPLLLRGKTSAGAYVCQDGTCRAPVTTAKELEALLG